MALGPSGGALKRLFNPANMKRKKISASGVSPEGGKNLQGKEMPPQFKKKLTSEKPKLMMARGAGMVLGKQKGY